ncbi:hypothetical protein ACLOJK_035577 [Asimina triloba]
MRIYHVRPMVILVGHLLSASAIPERPGPKLRYCMKEFHDEAPDNWVCEKCRSRDDPVSPRPEVKGCKPTPCDNSDTPVRRSLPESSVKGSIPRNSPTEKSFPSKSPKVKFIPADEAKLLSSGVRVIASRSRFGCSSPRPKKATLSSVLRRTASLKDNLQKGISRTNSVISQPTAPHVMGLENVTLHPPSVKPPNPLRLEASSGVECKPKTSERLAKLKSSSQVDLGPAISKPLINGKQEEDEACRLRHVVAPAHVSPRKLSSRVDAGPPISKPLINGKQDEDEACRLRPVVAPAHVSPRKLSSQVDPGPAVSKPLINGKQEEDEARRLRPVFAPAHVSLRKLSSRVDPGLPISKPLISGKQDEDEACRLCPVVAPAHVSPRKLSSQVDPGPAISKPLINGKQQEDEACRLHAVVAPAHVSPRKLSSLLEEKLPNHPLPDALWK